MSQLYYQVGSSGGKFAGMVGVEIEGFSDPSYDDVRLHLKNGVKPWLNRNIVTEINAEAYQAASA